MKKKVIAVIMAIALCSTMGAWITPGAAYASETEIISEDNSQDDGGAEAQDITDEVAETEEIEGMVNEPGTDIQHMDSTEENLASESDVENEAEVEDSSAVEAQQGLSSETEDQSADEAIVEEAIAEEPIASVEHKSETLQADTTPPVVNVDKITLKGKKSGTKVLSRYENLLISMPITEKESGVAEIDVYFYTYDSYAKRWEYNNTVAFESGQFKKNKDTYQLDFSTFYYLWQPQKKTCIGEIWVVDKEGNGWMTSMINEETGKVVSGYSNAVNNTSFTYKNLERIYGASRYETAMGIADAQKGGVPFETVIVACGTNYADALSGSYLSNVTGAPILIVDPAHEQQIIKYITSNTVKKGKVYLLGGKAVVSQNVETQLKNKGYSVSRLWGQTRYETNLAILKEADRVYQKANENWDDTWDPNDEYIKLIVCTGSNFADSLSASATGLPILLVDKELSASQKAYLKNKNKTTGIDESVVLGGPAVVKPAIATQVKSYSKKQKRIYGQTRYETSVKIAEEFFIEPDGIALAYAQNFPDGLCGGALACWNYTPMILVSNDNYGEAVKYAKKIKNKTVTVFGGPTLISNSVAKKMLQ